MEKFRIFVKPGKNNRDNDVGVNIYKESRKEEVREIILVIKKCLEDKFPAIEIHITPGADKFLR